MSLLSLSRSPDGGSDAGPDAPPDSSSGGIGPKARTGGVGGKTPVGVWAACIDSQDL